MNSSPHSQPLQNGSRVFYATHPEYGFGIVKLIEEDAFGDTRCHVAFEHSVGTLPATVSDLVVVGQPDEELKAGALGAAEVFSRKLAAALIIQENHRTGSFMRTAVEPLPHQAFLLEKVWTGGRFGHLIADDVGLGKTVEAGLIITALLQEQPAARVLVVCPAGVALQWQDEMEEHFGHYFSVMGRDSDFQGKSVQSWRGRNLVIAPIDRLKRDELRALLPEVGPFDLVVCDEAHRLTAKRDFITEQLRTTGNYRLLKEMVDAHTVQFVAAPDGAARSPRLLLLSATPHQGDDLRFAYLLELIRPDLVPSAEALAQNPIPFELMKECVSRTPKSHAVGWDRKPVFKGHQTTTVEVHWSEVEQNLSKALTRYLQTSFTLGTETGTCSPLVLSLVMHTFHKLAASSWLALGEALRSRLAAIEAGVGRTAEFDGTSDEGQGELVKVKATPRFFDAEPIELAKLITEIDALTIDSKWEGCRKLLEMFEDRWPSGKILFFTQYRATQDLLCRRLAEIFPAAKVAMLHGEMSLEERKEARMAFEGPARFLVSTEAGGEGINLQKACHLMVNYDVTWNPMRMQQRTGRLDRFGQKHRVEVFNLRVPESWDHRIFARIEERLASVQAAMGALTEHAEDYREMILGVVAEEIDESKLFAEQVHGAALDEGRGDQLIQSAIRSADRWKSMLKGDLGFTAAEELRRPALTPSDFEATYGLLLAAHEVRMQKTRLPDNTILGGVFHFTPPAGFKEPVVRATKDRYVAFDRSIFAEVKGKVIKRARGQMVTPALAGFGDALTNWLFEKAFVARRLESAFSLRADPASWALGNGSLLVAGLKWMGTGRRMRAADSLVGCFLPAGDTAWKVIGEERLMELALHAAQGPARAVEVSSLTARKLVQGQLKRLIETHNPDGRAAADWFWMLAAVIECSPKKGCAAKTALERLSARETVDT